MSVIKMPYYELDEETKSRIIMTAYACRGLGLSNFSFEYYPLAGKPSVKFSMLERTNLWDLTVKVHPWNDPPKRDCYKVILNSVLDDAKIEFTHTE